MQKYILKADGAQEIFDEEKIKSSLQRAGTEPENVASIIDIIKKHLEEISKSKDIYRLVIKHLTKKQPEAAMRYTLKEAMMDMGPTGYVFEKYMAKILKEYGYDTKVGTIVKGFCVDHEIDVIACKGGKHYMIECKYHNNRGVKSDIQTALYVYARFLDLEKANPNNGEDYQFDNAWLATNTKCTSECIKYANCVKMRIIAWHYPEDKNLEYYIEKKKLYPVSVLPGLKKVNKERLFENNIFTVKDLLKQSSSMIQELLSIDKSAADMLLAKAAMIIL